MSDIFKQTHRHHELSFEAMHAIKEVKDTYGDKVFVKPKSLFKFGRNQNVGTSSLVQIVNMEQNETFVSSNAIDSISSSSAADTATVTLECHTISGSDLTFFTQTVTLQGQTKVSLGTPCARVSRLLAPSSLNGDVYVYEDDTVVAGVPQTASKIHMKVSAGENQSQKCATSFSSTDYFFLTMGYCAVNKKTDAVVDVRMRVRQVGNDFRTGLPVSVARGQPLVMRFSPWLIIPKNSDIIVSALSSAANTDVTAGFQGFLAKVYTE